MINLKSSNTVPTEHSVAGISGREDLLPSLVSAYQERGYEAGYSRGVNDTLATVLEAAEEFARLKPQSAMETRRLLYAFSEFLEQQIGGRPSRSEDSFVDGSGI